MEDPKIFTDTSLEKQIKAMTNAELDAAVERMRDIPEGADKAEWWKKTMVLEKEQSIRRRKSGYK